MTEYSVDVKKFQPTDPRLGRHVRHDSRSLSYQVEAVDPATLRSVRHERYVPVFDQGEVGSCTGNASTGCIATGEMFWVETESMNILSTTDAVADEQYAVGVYSEATSLDGYTGSYPPDDTGSDGLSVAKVLQKRGLISGYQHATSLEAVLTALATQPVIVGTEWRKDMFTPDPDGRLHITGETQGGHEYLLDELDVENGRIWMTNSWSTSWGVGGRAYFTWDDFKELLAAQGDCTVFVPVSQPAPVPTPPSPEPAPTPSPEPDPLIGDFKAELISLCEKLRRLIHQL